MKDSVLHIKIFMGWFEVTFPPLWGKVEWCFVYTPPETLLLGFPGGSDSKESACNVGDLGSVSGLGRCPGEGRQRNLAGYSPCGCKGSDTTEQLTLFFLFPINKIIFQL